MWMLATEMLVFATLALWMGYRVWRFARGDKRYGDTASLVVMCFSLLLIYRDWRIVFVDDSDNAKIIMVVLGVSLAGFTALAARAYGRGAILE